MIEVIFDVSEKLWPIVSGAIAAASIAIRLLPELPEDHWAKPTVKFIGKYVAINRPRDGKVQLVINSKE